MRLRGFVSRRRFLLSALRDKVSRGTELLPRVPLPAEPRSVTRSPNTETEVYNDYHQSERFLLLVHPGSVY